MRWVVAAGAELRATTMAAAVGKTLTVVRLLLIFLRSWCEFEDNPEHWEETRVAKAGREERRRRRERGEETKGGASEAADAANKRCRQAFQAVARPEARSCKGTEACFPFWVTSRPIIIKNSPNFHSPPPFAPP